MFAFLFSRCQKDLQNICLRPEVCSLYQDWVPMGTSKKIHLIKWFLASLRCEHKIKLEEQRNTVLSNSLRLIVPLNPIQDLAPFLL